VAIVTVGTRETITVGGAAFRADLAAPCHCRRMNGQKDQLDIYSLLVAFMALDHLRRD
jgi:hypothetical protein